METKKRIIVGMSGGVDSSVAAYLLKQQGHEVIGLFMKNWDETQDNGVCTSTQDYSDVAAVCEKLDIPYYSINFTKEYWDNVFKDFLSDYAKGFTPNPDILCNREIKFKAFYQEAMKLGADMIATGHYCQTNAAGELLKGADNNKDQSYFLHAVKADVLSKTLFPIGNLPKPEVRRIAKELGLITSEKKDSTGICFIGERNFKNFLSQYIKKHQGYFEDLDGQRVGRHDGVPYYTLGQRKGLGLGGAGEAWFVVGKDVNRNVVQVVRGERHPALYADSLQANEITWVGEAPTLPLKCKAKVRYRQKDQDCTVIATEKGLEVVFDQPQRAMTPGQAVVFYQENICLGGAVITEVGASYFTQQKSLPEFVVV
ncbi:MAG: tRNA 2-thiouridine(34) synthase MnmA [Bacteriovoracaceae bacterium]|nr:tRNA 2-thiouridine(34) synthase MnmA [Bacteriovoracaceae bacterium]